MIFHWDYFIYFILFILLPQPKLKNYVQVFFYKINIKYKIRQIYKVSIKIWVELWNIDILNIFLLHFQINIYSTCGWGGLNIVCVNNTRGTIKIVLLLVCSFFLIKIYELNVTVGMQLDCCVFKCHFSLVLGYRPYLHM